MLTDEPPFPVVSHFGLRGRGEWRRAATGFSGAVVWLGFGGRPVAVKMWPADTPAERVRQIHAWMGAARHLPFVPAVYGLFEHDGHIWDCCALVPGVPRERPTAEEVRAACIAVARLHDAWAGPAPRCGPGPCVRNRLHMLAGSEPLLRADQRVRLAVHPDLDPLLRHTIAVAARLAPLAMSALRRWERREFGSHACVRDLRGEHVLFGGSGVTGIIDYGAAGFDHPAADLARLLGDYAETDPGLFDAGMAAYRAARPRFDAPDEYVRLLMRTGDVCSALGWLNRLAVGRDPVADAAAVAARLARVLARAERIEGF
jgi:homoserine kinase type II